MVREVCWINDFRRKSNSTVPCCVLADLTHWRIVGVHISAKLLACTNQNINTGHTSLEKGRCFFPYSPLEISKQLQL